MLKETAFLFRKAVSLIEIFNQILPIFKGFELKYIYYLINKFCECQTAAVLGHPFLVLQKRSPFSFPGIWFAQNGRRFP